MNHSDPTAPEINNLSMAEQELSIEEAAQLQAAENASTETISGEPGIEAAQQTSAGPGLPLPIPFPKRPVSGRYRNQGPFWHLELRVDVDGKRPMKRVSGDFFQKSGATITYFGSFVVNSPTISVTPATVVIEGVSTGTYATGFPKVRVTIPRTLIIQPPAAATIQFFSLSNAPGATYVCAFQSVYFRTVQIETDKVSDVSSPVFASYNTGSLPSGGPARTLSVVTAYAEAGIEMQNSGTADTINIGEAGANTTWSNAELHASMVNHFSLWKDDPQWKVWLLDAQKHDLGPGLYGIMFDQQGKQRQGCATFYQGIGGTTADKLRLQLYTSVHELGHCFNLLHSWQKSFAVPAVPNRPAALSYMNYPWNYPGGGAPGFWSAFPFQFDDQEVIHMRHAFRNNVVMDGSNLAVGPGLQETTAFADPVQDHSGLRFTISTRKNLAYGQPVHLEFKLEADGSTGRQVHTYLNPNTGFVQVGIRNPSGHIRVYEPLMHLCVAPDATILDANRPAVEDSAYVGFGKDGFYFDQPGAYQIRAVYYALDGSQVMSNILNVRVRHPVTAAEEDLAELFLGEEQGTLLFLNGSDSESLSRGNEAFDTVLEKYGKHPLATYARIVKGVNAGRTFKTITTEKKLEVRDPQSAESIKLLSAAIDTAEPGTLDPITMDNTIHRLAQVQRAAGDDKGAAATMKRSTRRAAAATRGSNR